MKFRFETSYRASIMHRDDADGSVIRLNHLSRAVFDFCDARDWYVASLRRGPEFELPERRVAAVQDDAEFTSILAEARTDVAPAMSTFADAVDDVESWHRRLSLREILFVYPPRRNCWGYGAALLDPDGYRIRLSDEKSMREKGQP